MAKKKPFLVYGRTGFAKFAGRLGGLRNVWIKMGRKYVTVVAGVHNERLVRILRRDWMNFCSLQQEAV